MLHIFVSMMTSSNGNIFRVTGPLCGDFTGPGDLRRHRGHYDVSVMSESGIIGSDNGLSPIRRQAII